MKSIFRYPGGKSGLRDQIMSLAPDYTEYREPFVGGGGVFFGVPKDKRRWINDRDEGLMAVYRALKTDPLSFIRTCQRIKPLETGEGLDRLQGIFHQFAQEKHMDAALRYYFLHRTHRGGIPLRISSSPYFSNPNGWNIIWSDLLWQAAGLLSRVNITEGDYLPLLQAPGEDVWIYCDPPYYRLTLLPKASRLYKYGFSKEQHVQFAEHVKACPHNVLVSYDDCPFVRDLYSDSIFRTTSVSAFYCLRDGGNRKEKELLISNYELPRRRSMGHVIALARL